MPECALPLKHFYDMFCQGFLYLPMSRNGLTNPGFRILVSIVPRATANQDASAIFNPADKIAALHDNWSSATRRTLGIFPPVSSL